MEGSASSESVETAVLAALSSRGWRFAEENEEIRSLIRSRQTAESVESALLNMDMRSFGGKMLPDPSSLKKLNHLSGPMILQVEQYLWFAVVVAAIYFWPEIKIDWKIIFFSITLVKFLFWSACVVSGFFLSSIGIVYLSLRLYNLWRLNFFFAGTAIHVQTMELMDWLIPYFSDWAL